MDRKMSVPYECLFGANFENLMFLIDDELKIHKKTSNKNKTRVLKCDIIILHIFSFKLNLIMRYTQLL